MSLELDGITGLSTTGNVAGTYILGNGAYLTGINASSSGNSISYANSNVVVNNDGNVTISIDAQANTVLVSPSSLFVDGSFAGPKNITANTVVDNNVNALLIGPVSVAPNTTISVPTGSTVYVFGG